MTIWLVAFSILFVVSLTLWLRLGTTPAADKSGTPPAPGGLDGPVIYYRTKDGRADYGFIFKQLSGGCYRIYIASQPSYGIWPSGIHATHRLTDGQRYYICWSGMIATEAQARAVAALWAEKTQAYIRTGQSF
jgi:hypothetical protein